MRISERLYSIALLSLSFSFCIAPTHGQELIGYWQFEEDYRALDSSTSGHRFGHYSRGADPSLEGASTFGSGTYFNGKTGIIRTRHGINQIDHLANDFTVMAWMKPQSLQERQYIFDASSHSAGWSWGVNSESLELDIPGVHNFVQSVPLKIDEWVHAAIVLDSDNDASFFIDGRLHGRQAHFAPARPAASSHCIGGPCSHLEEGHFHGTLDEVAIFDGALTEEQIQMVMANGAMSYVEPRVLGDYNGNGQRDVDDLDIHSAAMRNGDYHWSYDFDGDGQVNHDDRLWWIQNLSNTFRGDANFDGEWNSSDFVAVFKLARYETGEAATFSEGDQNGDGLFNSSDFVTGFAGGGYEQGPRDGGLMVVPEPSNRLFQVLTVGLIAAWYRRQRHGRRSHA